MACAVAMHTLPSPAYGANQNDQWWTLGLISETNSTELASLSGPTAANRRNSVTKALQGKFLEYPDTWLNLRPGAVVEKTFWLEAVPQTVVGSGFRQPLRTAMRLHPLTSPEGLPGYDEIIREKCSGEQIQQTNFGQHGDMSDVFRLRGGYSESWTVFWITAHFLNAASEFERMGVDLDRIEESIAQTLSGSRAMDVRAARAAGIGLLH